MPDPFPGDDAEPIFPRELLEQASTPALPPRRRRARWFGPLLVTTSPLAPGAPRFDPGVTQTVDDDGTKGAHGSYTIRLGRPGGWDSGLVLAWRHARAPWPFPTRLRIARHRLGIRVLWPAVELLLRAGWFGDAPRCDGCGVPITGQPFYGGEGAEELCRGCAPMEGCGGSSS